MIFLDKEFFLTLPLSQSKPARDWILLKSRRPLYELCLPKVKLKDEQLGMKDKIIPQMWRNLWDSIKGKTVELLQDWVWITFMNKNKI